jgi:hypothetical protein
MVSSLAHRAPQRRRFAFVGWARCLSWLVLTLRFVAACESGDSFAMLAEFKNIQITIGVVAHYRLVDIAFSENEHTMGWG